MKMAAPTPTPVDAGKSDQVVEARPKSDNVKTWVIVGLAIVSGLLLYWHFKRQDLVVNITGQQIILALLIGGALIYWFFKRDKIPELPPKDKIAFDCAEWEWRHGAGLFDYTNCEVQVISDQRALVYFPNNEKTLEYDVRKGVVGERWRDLDSDIKIREAQKVSETLMGMRVKDEHLRKMLEDRGFNIDE